MRRTITRAGAYRRPAFFLALALCAALVASCYTSGYKSEMKASAALVADLSQKLGDYCQAGFVLGGRAVTSEEMGEFYYGLQKARAFESMTRGQQQRPSRRKYAQLVDSYDKFVHDADRYRLSSSRTREQLDELMKERNAAAQLADQVTAALESEPN